jgi:tetratricopeptide (TPR) repeat protein
MSRVRRAVEAKNFDLAIKLLDAIVVLRPDYIEAWNRRATLHYMRKDFDRSLEDIRQTLARESRHFGALAGLGMIMQELGEDKRALEVYRKAVEVNPHLPRIPDLIKSLTEKVEGRDI